MDFFSDLKFPWKKYFFDEFWEPVIILDSKYKIFDINKKLRTLTGYEREELIGKSPNLILQNIFTDPGKIEERDVYDRKVIDSQLISKSGLKISVKVTFQSFDGQRDNWYFFTFIRDTSHENDLQRQLDATKSFALSSNQITSAVIRQESYGPEYLYSEQFKFVIDRYPEISQQKDELLKISLVLTTALGQGGAYATGVSQIPVYDYEVTAVCFTKIVNDENNSEDRLKDKSYLIFVIFFPKKLSSLINKSDELNMSFKNVLDQITDVKQINQSLMQNLKRSILCLDISTEETNFSD